MITKQDKYITIWGSRVHYMVEGGGTKPILFLHGWPGPFEGFGKVVEYLSSNGPEFKTIAEKFLKEYRIVGLDWPGFGKSLGGYIALAAQQKYGYLFNKMAIFGLTKDLSHFWVFRFARVVTKVLGRRLSVVVFNLVKRSSLLINFFRSAIFPESEKKQTQKYVRSALEIPTRVTYEIMKGFLKKDFAANIGRGVKIPVTFVGAELDPMFPIAEIKEFASEVGNSRVIVVEGDDHSASAHIDRRVGLYRKLLSEFIEEDA